MRLDRSRTRLITALAVVALGSVIFGWTSTPAGGIASNVTISYSSGAFSGVVQANVPCAAGRTVTVTKAGKGTIGTATTDGAGNWTLTKRRARGTFTASVSASTVTTGGGTGYGYSGQTVTCDADTSDPLERKKKRRRGGGGGGGPGRPDPRIPFPSFERLFRQFRQLFPGFDFDIPRF